MLRQQNKITVATLLFLSVITYEISTTEVERPRGVSIARAPLYSPADEFVCLDNKLKIPFTRVNDDYCDCEDGSDEPGTSACPNGVFHCSNVGYKPKNIPSSRVNDGICDCCDGSDEYSHPKSNCHNYCSELGMSDRLETARRNERIKQGSAKRKEIIQHSQHYRRQRSEKLEELRKNYTETEAIRVEYEQIKIKAEELENEVLDKYRKIEEEEKRKREEEENAANRQEATDYFNELDINRNSLVELNELLDDLTFDLNKDEQVTEEEVRQLLGETIESNLETFIEQTWPKIKTRLMAKDGFFQPPSDQEVEDAEKYAPETAGEDEDGEYGEIDEQEEVEEEKPDSPARNYDEHTQRLINESTAARSAYFDMERRTKEIKNEISDIEKNLEQDYGLEDEFLYLQDQCFEFSDREYTYKLCPFESASQQPKSGGAATRLGTWKEWSGPTQNKYEQMLYDNGASCWNGPQRSTRVYIECGLADQLVSVSEPNRCEYEMHFETPVVCYEAVDNQAQDEHDEL